MREGSSNKLPIQNRSVSPCLRSSVFGAAGPFPKESSLSDRYSGLAPFSNLRLSWRKPFRNFLLALTPEELPLWTAYRSRYFHIAARFRLTDVGLHFDGERPARLPTY